MAHILIVGIDPDLVDFSDPSLPPGVNADMIRRGIAACQEDLRAAGHEVHHRFIPPDPTDLTDFTAALTSDDYDCVVVGGGVRLPPRNLHLFERVLNIIARAPSAPRIALVSRPDDAATAVSRVLRG